MYVRVCFMYVRVLRQVEGFISPKIFKLISSSQFHQHFTVAFALIFFQQKITNPNFNKRKASKNTFVKNCCSKNVDEIDTRG